MIWETNWSLFEYCIFNSSNFDSFDMIEWYDGAKNLVMTNEGECYDEWLHFVAQTPKWCVGKTFVNSIQNIQETARQKRKFVLNTSDLSVMNLDPLSPLSTHEYPLAIFFKNIVNPTSFLSPLILCRTIWWLFLNRCSHWLLALKSLTSSNAAKVVFLSHINGPWLGHFVFDVSGTIHKDTFQFIRTPLIFVSSCPILYRWSAASARCFYVMQIVLSAMLYSFAISQRVFFFASRSCKTSYFCNIDKYFLLPILSKDVNNEFN